MTRFYPQAAMTLEIRWEDFRNESDVVLTKLSTLRVTPKNVRVNINDYKSADTFNAELEYKNFPFDPRTIRALGVTIHMRDMGHIVNQVGLVDQIDVTKNLIPGSKQDVVFMGFADEDTITLDEGSQRVRFEGRDFTSLMIDKPWDKKGPIDLARPLTVVIQEILLQNEATQEIFIENRTGAILPNIGLYAPSFTPLGTTKNKKKNDTYWDVIQDIVARAGLVAYIELDKLIITKPRALFDKSNAKQFVYGSNLKSLEMHRKIGRMKDINVRVMSLNIEKKQVLKIDIPRQAKPDWLQAMNLSAVNNTTKKLKPTKGQEVKEVTETAPFLTFRIPEITNEDHLKEVGQSIYEELGRQQLEGSLQTREMSICDGGVPFDVTNIRNGTPIDIEVNHDDLTGLRRLDTESARTQWLINRKYAPIVARALAKATGKFGTPFYTKSVEFSFDAESGFSMKLDFMNFIEISDRALGR